MTATAPQLLAAACLALWFLGNLAWKHRLAL